MKRRASWLDGFALCASSLCTIHCLGLPLLFAVLPAFAGRVDPSESFHIIMLALAIPTSLSALIMGRRHSGKGPIVMGVCGLALMATGTFLTTESLWEAVSTVAGSVLLAAAHVLNWRRGIRAVAVVRPGR